MTEYLPWFTFSTTKINQKEVQVIIRTNTSDLVFSSILEETVDKYQNMIHRINELRLNAWFMHGLTQHSERKEENQNSFDNNDQIKNDESTETTINRIISSLINAYEEHKMKKILSLDSTPDAKSGQGTATIDTESVVVVEVGSEVHIGHNHLHYSINHRGNKL